MSTQIYPNISDDEIKICEKLLSEGKLPHKFAMRVQTVLARAKKIPTQDIAKVLGLRATTISIYVKRFNSGGIDSLLHDKSRKPGKKPISDETKNAICKLVCTTKPENATHWTCAAIGKKFKISANSVSIILRKRKLKPHLVQSFQFSNDKHFDEKLDDVVGLYLDPPENAVVFCVDEKTQIQALERTQPILPLCEKIPERQSHDYYRHGTTTLFAALAVATGKVSGSCEEHHTRKEFLKFLKKLDKETDRTKVLHVIIDNYATHKTKEVLEYVENSEGRIVLHFIPTHSSWLNLVERWFAEITSKRIRRESWESVQELEKGIMDFIRNWNETGKKYVWIKTATQIRASINKAKKRYADYTK